MWHRRKYAIYLVKYLGGFTETQNLIILGGGDLGREIHFNSKDVICKTKYNTIAFVDENPSKIGTTIDDIPVVSMSDIVFYKKEEPSFILGLGDVSLRYKIYKEICEVYSQAHFANIIHKSAVILSGCIFGEGVFVAPNCSISICTKLDSHVVVNQNVSLGHDVEIKAFSVVSPGSVLSGRTTVGERCFLGSAVTTYPGVKIGDNCAISSGTILPSSLKANTKLISKPNTIMLHNEERKFL